MRDIICHTRLDSTDLATCLRGLSVRPRSRSDLVYLIVRNYAQSLVRAGRCTPCTDPDEAKVMLSTIDSVPLDCVHPVDDGGIHPAVLETLMGKEVKEDDESQGPVSEDR